MNNDQVAHLWANKSQQSASGSNFFFEGDLIFSFGRHFPIARHYKGVVLFTGMDRSPTTGRHKSTVLGASSHLEVFTVANPLRDPSGEDVKNYAAYIKRISTNVAKKRDPSSFIDQIERVVAEANKFCEKFKFSTRFTVPDLTELKEKAKLLDSKRKKSDAIAKAKFERESAVLVAQWIAGADVRLPGGLEKVYLRKRWTASIPGGESNRIMETSKGARVPLDEAKKAFRFVMLKRESGWHRNGDRFAVGSFQLDKVTTIGVSAGCHLILWDEIERFAKTQGWL